MKKLLSIISFLLLFTGVEASAEIFHGYVYLNGQPTSAEYTVLSGNTLALGSGQNACISEYSSGHVIVPSQIEIETVVGLIPRRKTYKVTQVMPFAFRFCTQITMVQFREGITHIGNFAFKGCRNLEELVLPSTLTSVGSGAFIGLDKLNLVTCNAVIPPTWEYNDVFYFHEKGISDDHVYTFRQGVFLNVPAESAAAYKSSVFSNSSLGWTTPEGWGTLFSNINGSALENYHVCDAQDLEDVRRISNNVQKFGNIKNLWIESDIVMSDTIWPNPIGANPNEPFKATIHGQGHSISYMCVDNDDVAALIGYYEGKDISSLRIKHGQFNSKHLAAGLVASAKDCTIDSCYVDCGLRANDFMGGLVAKADGKCIIDRCFSEGQMFCQSKTATPYMGGLVGYAKEATITNCAVMSQFDDGNKSGHFVGGSEHAGNVFVDYSYSMNPSLPNTLDNSQIKHGDHIILYGQKATALIYSGEKLNFEYSGAHMQCTYPASVLGTESWVYTWDQYPMPDCFVNEWPVKDNYVVYGSKGAMNERDNVLTPDEEIPAEAWLDLTEIGFRHYKFKASRLRINERLNVQSRAEELPLGIAKQIVSTNGVVHDVVLPAIYQGMKDVMLPVYEIDDNNNFVTDADGNPHLLGETKVGEEEVWQPVGYAISLPYDVTFGANVTLYQPTSIYEVNGQTTALFEPVRNNRAEPFRAYYLLVHRDSVILGTQATVTCTSLEGAISQVGDFEFSGAMSNTDYSARKRNTYTLKDGSWQRQAPADLTYAAIEPFSSFFRAVGNNTPNKIEMTFSDDNPVISFGDFYFSINTGNTEGTEATVDNVTATLTGYHGRGGNVVVPPTAPYVVYGQEKQVPVTSLAPDIFTKNTAQLWSIDLSQCKDISYVTVDRTKPGNPFFKVDERTIIYLPEGKSQPGKNLVVGEECQSVTITDKWDFRPPYDFHADEAEYSRILYATKLKDGTYQSYAYTVCLPFGMTEEDIHTFNPDKIVLNIYAIEYVNYKLQSFVFSGHPGILADSYYPQAGYPYLVVIKEGQFQFKARDTRLSSCPKEYSLSVMNFYNMDDDLGDFRGTFSRISNEEAAAMNAYSLNKGNWCRILSDQGTHRGAYIDAFRAYFEPRVPMPFNYFGTDYYSEPQGEDDIEMERDLYTDFPADEYVADSDFTGYEDVLDGIETIQVDPMSILNSNKWYSIDGRHINGVPTEKGLYINNGRKIVIK